MTRFIAGFTAVILMYLLGVSATWLLWWFLGTTSVSAQTQGHVKWWRTAELSTTTGRVLIWQSESGHCLAANSAGGIVEMRSCP